MERLSDLLGSGLPRAAPSSPRVNTALHPRPLIWVGLQRPGRIKTSKPMLPNQVPSDDPKDLRNKGRNHTYWVTIGNDLWASLHSLIYWGRTQWLVTHRENPSLKGISDFSRSIWLTCNFLKKCALKHVAQINLWMLRSTFLQICQWYGM